MAAENGRFSLKTMAEKTPPVNAVEAMRKQMAIALFDGVKEQDVIDVTHKLKELALAGDKQAIAMFLKLVLPQGKPAAAPPPAAAESVGLKLMAQAINDLVDEIRITKAQPLQIEDGTDDDE